MKYRIPDETHLLSPEELKHYSEHILARVPDEILDFLVYSRKECEDLPIGIVEQVVAQGGLTVDDITNAFTNALKEALSPP